MLQIQTNFATPKSKQNINCNEDEDQYTTPKNKKTTQSQRYFDLEYTPYLYRTRKKTTTENDFPNQQMLQSAQKFPIENKSSNYPCNTPMSNNTTQKYKYNQSHQNQYQQQQCYQVTDYEQSAAKFQTNKKINKSSPFSSDIQELRESYLSSSKKLDLESRKATIPQPNNFNEFQLGMKNHKQEEELNQFEPTMNKFFQYYNSQNREIINLIETYGTFEIVGEPIHHIGQTIYALSSIFESLELYLNNKVSVAYQKNINSVIQQDEIILSAKGFGKMKDNNRKEVSFNV